MLPDYKLSNLIRIKKHAHFISYIHTYIYVLKMLNINNCQISPILLKLKERRSENI